MTRAEWRAAHARMTRRYIFDEHMSHADALERARLTCEEVYGPEPPDPEKPATTGGGLPWYWRLTAKTAGAIGGIMFANLKRYLPLLSSLVLVVQTVLVALNKTDLANTVGGLAAFIGAAPAEVVTAVAAVGTTVGLVLKAISVLQTGIVAK